jgi:hypothetical protein
LARPPGCLVKCYQKPAEKAKFGASERPGANGPPGGAADPGLHLKCPAAAGGRLRRPGRACGGRGAPAAAGSACGGRGAPAAAREEPAGRSARKGPA